MINILGVMLYIEGYYVINILGDSMHTEYNVTRIVCVMSYREWVWYNLYPVFEERYSGYSVRYSGSDGKYNVCIVMGVRSYLGCVMS